MALAITADDLVRAHACSIRRRTEIEQSALCGCFHCKRAFLPSDITQWTDAQDVTALCPRCGIDSVIGSASGYPIDAEFLAAMHLRWFSN
jgi:hypothetical protein